MERNNKPKMSRSKFNGLEVTATSILTRSAVPVDSSPILLRTAIIATVFNMSKVFRLSTSDAVPCCARIAVTDMTSGSATGMPNIRPSLRTSERTPMGIEHGSRAFLPRILHSLRHAGS
jgi:hypothetical protein